MVQRHSGAWSAITAVVYWHCSRAIQPPENDTFGLQREWACELSLPLICRQVALHIKSSNPKQADCCDGRRPYLFHVLAHVRQLAAGDVLANARKRWHCSSLALQLCQRISQPLPTSFRSLGLQKEQKMQRAKSMTARCADSHALQCNDQRSPWPARARSLQLH